MGANMFYLAVTLFCVLGGAFLVKADGEATTPTPAPTIATEMTTDGVSTSGISTSGNSSSGSTGNMTTSMVTEAAGITSGGGNVQCLVCTGDMDSTCNSDEPVSSMTGIVRVDTCRSCRVNKVDGGKDTNITAISRLCNMTDACPSDLADPMDFRCNEAASIRACEWCCVGNSCNNFNRNGGNALVAGLVIDGWSTNKLLYVVMSAMAVSMSIPTMG
ncbi:uncharacterized protein LOC115919113 [Strongylocentrotus purpuratus]|uniref:Uncharacterized protein n=1 Tax=Strongylocentrotus purpuratus TaxID=7668 RepID=A0A7M7PU82_STRPU|nr:uncharacterized protein LOC115919113 [Strongylocentrotus purpuratus]